MSNFQIPEPRTGTALQDRPKTGRSIRSQLARLAAATAAAALLALPAPAWAHDTLISSDPADGAQMDEAPEEIELTFSGDLQDVGTAVQVTDSSGADVTDGDPVLNGPTVAQAVTPPGEPAGGTDGGTEETYTVVWRVVSSDGHPIEGTFTYDVGQGAGATDDASAVPAAPSSATPAQDQDSATGEADQAATETGDSDDGAPVWLYVAGGAVLVLVILGAVVAVRRIGGDRHDR